MPPISREEAESILGPTHLSNFVSAMQDAEQDWITFTSQWPDHTPRTRANFINDRIRSNIRSLYPSENRSFRIVEPRGAFFLLIQRVALRFKRLRGNRPSNIPTVQATLIEMNQLSLDEEMESPTVVNVGFVPNKSWAIWRYKISCFRGKVCLWEIDITPEIEQVAVAVQEEDSSVARKRVQKKKVE